MSRSLWVPGRIELFGKHVDYGGGPSLTCAASVGITSKVEILDEPVLELVQTTAGKQRFPLAPHVKSVQGSGANYATAVVRRLARDLGPLHRGVRVELESSIPRASGLSSSSAFVITLGLALIEANELDTHPAWSGTLDSSLALAEYLGAAESGAPFADFLGEHGVGTRGGAQDHVAILNAEEGRVGMFHYLPAVRRARATMPTDWVFLIGVSGVHASKGGGVQAEYNQASDTLRSIVAAWNRATGRADIALRAALESAPDALDRLSEIVARDPGSARLIARLRQFDRETRGLVPAAHGAISAGDASLLGELSHESQRLAEEVLGNQVPETIFLAKAAREAGAFAASAFGAGFGGAVWALVHRGEAPAVLARWQAAYRAAFPARERTAQWLETGAARGVQWG